MLGKDAKKWCRFKEYGSKSIYVQLPAQRTDRKQTDQKLIKSWGDYSVKGTVSPVVKILTALKYLHHPRTISNAVKRLIPFPKGQS